MNKDTDLHPDHISKKLAALTDAEFLDLGAGGLSYITISAHHQDEPVYTLHGADGSHIATGQDLNTIHVIAQQHHLIPMSVQ